MGKKTQTISPNGSVLTGREQRVVDYMTNHGSISAKEAETYLHEHRLATAISSLRHERGYNIDTVRIDMTNAYGEPTYYGRYFFAPDRDEDGDIIPKRRK